MIKQAILDQKLTEVERCHFKEFGDSSLLFEAVYYVASPEYGVYMDTQQAINFTLVEEFNKAQIEFAFPTRTVYVKNENINKDNNNRYGD